MSCPNSAFCEELNGASVEWYIKYLGAVEGGTGAPAVKFGETFIAFRKTDTATASAGSVIDHYGISVPDIDAAMQRLEGSGAKILEPVREAPGLFKLAFIEDPFGAKVELVQDAEWPDFHHVHLRVPDPTATLAWYEDVIGGTRDKLKGKIDGLRYGGVWLVAQDSGGEKLAPSDRRAIQNVAWVITDMDEAVAALTAAGAKTLVEPFAATDTVNRGLLRRSARRYRRGDPSSALENARQPNLRRLSGECRNGRRFPGAHRSGIDARGE